MPTTVVALSRRSALLLASLVAFGAGFAGGVIAPRGPTTTGEALLAMAGALGVGLLGGALARSRWALVTGMLAITVGVEIARRSLATPSLELRFDNVYGVIAFVITRGVHGLLLVLPMAAGVLAGIGLARRLEGAPRAGRWPIGSWLVGGASIALAVLVAWPASTPPVLGEDGGPARDGIAELATISAGGTDQALLIRAADPDKPVLLYLSGGPGQSDLALARVLSEPWTRDFVVADLDQRGNGKSYPAIDPVADMTLERAVSDVIEVTEYLAERFDEPRVYLVGESWGTILGVLAVQRRPDLYHAFLGSGQMVNVLETDRRIYADLLAYAARAGDTELAAQLGEIGAPPYRDMPWANSNLLAWYEHLYKPYTPSEGYLARGDAAGLDPFGALGSEYAFIEKTNVLRGLIDTFSVMYPQLYTLDFRESATRLDVPVYLLDGAAELDGRRSLALEWFDALEAPLKERITFEGAAHSVAFEQADEVLRLLNERIVPATDAVSGARGTP